MTDSPNFQSLKDGASSDLERSAKTHPLTDATGVNLLTVAEKSQGALAPGDYKDHFQSQGQEREYELHIPKGFNGTGQLPVVYMLHGLTENMDMMREYSNMNKLADKNGFAVAYLQALPQRFPGLPFYHENSWNLDHGTLTPRDPKYNDLDYFKTVKAAIDDELPTDAHRQFIAGFSEGGQAAQYIAHEMPGTFAGIASVHGTLLETDPRPNSSDPTASIFVLGNDDNVLPLKGHHGWFQEGALLKGWVLFTVPKVSQSEPLAQAPAWAAANGDSSCQRATTRQEDDTICTGGAEPVEQIIRLRHREADGKKRGGEHAWDGGNGGWSESHPDLLTWISKPVRKPDPEFDASEAVVDFLLQHPKQ